MAFVSRYLRQLLTRFKSSLYDETELRYPRSRHSSIIRGLVKKIVRESFYSTRINRSERA